MDLLDNPFHTLGASPRDSRKRILELADDLSLIGEEEQCMEARSDLTNPRKRLKAEIAWILGVRPTLASELLSKLQTSPREAINVGNLHSLAKANLIASALPNLKPENAEQAVEWILELSQQFEIIEKDKVLSLINEERVVSGFPEVSDPKSVESELEERRVFFRKAIKKVLDHLSSDELVRAVTKVVDIATNEGQVHSPVLIEDIVDTYEIEAQEFLQNEGESILALVALIERKLEEEISDEQLFPLIDKLNSVVRNWDAVAQPIQVLTMSLGKEHEASRKLASEVRGLAIHMFNDYGKLDHSRKLTEMLQEVFAEVVQVAEQTAEDADALEDIAEQREQHLENAKAQEEEWRRQVTYETEVGAVFKDKLRISPDGVEWKGKTWPLDDIQNVRWGATKNSVNGIPTGTTYSIYWGDGSSGVNLELRKEATFSNFVDRLWKTVGVRLLTEFLEELGKGKSFRFGSAIFRDDGVELEKKKFFSSNERIFCKWNELQIWNGGGSFCIGKSDDKKLAEGFSYQEENNIHILEAAIRAYWKRGGGTLSSLLQ